ncbi:hypothetical protein [Dyella sp. 20L07]|uniref:hypothetical protein n=1 Tax=Dyella sp. 20L07 TaxID=3384240 RepID=UPI003D295111
MITIANKTLLSLLIGLTLSSVAMAQTTVPTAAGDSSKDSQASAQAAPATQQKPPRPGDRNCIQSTGSLIPPKPGTCLGVPGRSYSRDDIQRTGSPTLGPALRDLDPSLTVSGH